MQLAQTAEASCHTSKPLPTISTPQPAHMPVFGTPCKVTLRSDRTVIAQLAGFVHAHSEQGNHVLRDVCTMKSQGQSHQLRSECTCRGGFARHCHPAGAGAGQPHAATQLAFARRGCGGGLSRLHRPQGPSQCHNHGQHDMKSTHKVKRTPGS